ncbi:uncharacterized protein B0H18DRAFT_958318 [Fomitopsis serialis]|uniref:uncharacterized protein n=1 Tax=Fomitopsis serialis TaxID=139415 RepID=UPI0020073A70|nr:uncharacterized protein B0H18DRAFT_958318 [Neoantrodia serialis]KAH9917567.1 hypothetical protein B0H18DRAFT_958318 [Neoantrodia serialis]
MPGADGKLAWFVNKIKWDVSATVFLNADPDLTCSMINEAVDSILTWLHNWKVDENIVIDKVHGYCAVELLTIGNMHQSNFCCVGNKSTGSVSWIFLWSGEVGVDELLLALLV